MISEVEVLNEIKNLRLKTELLANPCYNDGTGSSFWTKIDNMLKEVETELKIEISWLKEYLPPENFN